MPRNITGVTKRPDGTWRARYRDETGREHARHFPTQEEADEWRTEQRRAIRRGEHVDPTDRTTFAEFYAVWSARQVWAPGTVAAMNLAAGSVTFAGVPLRSLRRSHIESWVKGMDGRGLAPGTIHTRVNNVRAVLRGAVADRHLTSDPGEGVKLPRRRRREAAMTLPTDAEVGAILQAADDAFRAFVALCAFAGLRLGEAAAVQVDDVDFLRRTLTVARQVQRKPGGVELRAPKYGSERTVYLAPSLVDLLASHVAAHCPDETSSARWLFHGSGDQPPHQNTVGHRWQTTCVAAGVAGVRLHDLRHFYASGLIAAGCDVVTVQRALGHASATTTLNTYSHLWPTAEDRTRRAAEGLLAKVCGPDADRTEQTSR